MLWCTFCSLSIKCVITLICCASTKSSFSEKALLLHSFNTLIPNHYHSVEQGWVLKKITHRIILDLVMIGLLSPNLLLYIYIYILSLFHSLSIRKVNLIFVWVYPPILLYLIMMNSKLLNKNRAVKIIIGKHARCKTPALQNILSRTFVSCDNNVVRSFKSLVWHFVKSDKGKTKSIILWSNFKFAYKYNPKIMDSDAENFKLTLPVSILHSIRKEYWRLKQSSSSLPTLFFFFFF